MSSLVWVTGAGGLIGSHIAELGRKAAPDCAIRPILRSDLDLCDFAAVEEAFRREQPALIIHCAAMSRSPDCEANPTLARRVNFEATKHLAQLAEAARLVFFSTDLVFDGRAGNYAEEASVNPLSVYGETKVAAEDAVLANPRHLVIRTSLTAGQSPTGDRGLDEQLRQAWQRQQRPRLFVDEFRSPVTAPVTARALWELLSHEVQGLYHLAGGERLSRWEIGQLIKARSAAWDPHIEPASLKEYRGAPRAPDTSLNCRKAQALLSFPLPSFRECLA